jgi:UDPglucose 6-dehydrogenase
VTRIGFVGLSHLGLVASLGVASRGHDVIAVDDDAARVQRLAAGELPIHEPGLPELLAGARGRIRFSADFSELASCDLVLFTLDTPTDQADRSNQDAVRRQVLSSVPHLADGVVLVLMSQVVAGFTRALHDSIAAARPTLRFTLYYWVETLVIGNAVDRFLNPERIVLGAPESPWTPHPHLASLLSDFRCPLHYLRYESAELTKAAINLYLSLSVSFANSLADLCEAIGASMTEIVPALRGDRRIGAYAYIRPGLGITGGNLERDLVHLQGLATRHGVDATLVGAVLELNGRRYDWITRQLEREIGQIPGRPRLALWGLAYKKDTSSIKNSPAIRLVHDWAPRAAIVAYDPRAVVPALDGDATRVAGPMEALPQADCLVVATEWDEFASADLPRMAALMRRPVMVDCTGVVNGAAARAAGFRYVAIGEPV